VAPRPLPPRWAAIRPRERRAHLPDAGLPGYDTVLGTAWHLSGDERGAAPAGRNRPRLRAAVSRGLGQRRSTEGLAAHAACCGDFHWRLRCRATEVAADSRAR